MLNIFWQKIALLPQTLPATAAFLIPSPFYQCLSVAKLMFGHMDWNSSLCLIQTQQEQDH